MARAPDARVDQAKELYQQGKKLVEISAQLGVPEGTVRRWKHTYGWDGERSGKKSERSKKKNERSERVKKAVAEEVGQVIENPDLNDKHACITFDASTLQKPTRKRTVVIMQRRHLSDIDCWRKMELEPKSSA